MTVADSDDGMARERFFCGGVELDPSDARLGNHVLKQIDFDDVVGLLGWSLVFHRPQYLQYLVLQSEADTYYWVVGCFGESIGLLGGTGYAVTEYNDPAKKRKFVAEGDFRTRPKSGSQLSFFVEDSTDIDAEDFRTRGLIYLPSWTAMTNDYDKAVEAMRRCGWQVNGLLDDERR